MTAHRVDIAQCFSQWTIELCKDLREITEIKTANMGQEAEEARPFVLFICVPPQSGDPLAAWRFAADTWDFPIECLDDNEQSLRRDRNVSTEQGVHAIPTGAGRGSEGELHAPRRVEDDLVQYIGEGLDV